MNEHDTADTDESATTDENGGVDADADGGDEADTETEIETEAEREGETDIDTDTDAADAGGADQEDIEELTARVREASNEGIAREIASLRALVADIEGRAASEAASESESEAETEAATEAERIEELEAKLARKQADFENFKKRMDRKRATERERATEDLVTRLLGVRDDLARALDQEGDADIRGGVATTLDAFDRVLDDEGVSEINPEPGSILDPERHEAMLRVDSDHPEGAVAEVFRSGYEMGGKVLRPAQVTVSENGDNAGDE